MPTPSLHSAFPCLSSGAYLNAGTCGPVPTASVEAMHAVTQAGLRGGRGLPYYEALVQTSEQVRGAWADLLGAPAEEMALTTGASDGLTRALSMLEWAEGDEIVTTDEEHPGLLGPLGALVRRYGVVVREVPWNAVADAITPATQLVAVSHVSWLRGAVLDLAALAGHGVPVLVDGAQSAGAIPVDLARLRQDGVVAYAAAGQKWTCGPVGTGALWVDELWAPDRGVGVWPTYGALADPASGLDATAWPDARRFDAPSLSLELLSGALASLHTLSAVGWDAVLSAAVAGASRLADRLTAADIDVLDRGPSTLVSWTAPDAEAVVARATAAGVTIRGFPGLPYLRASVGAWTTDEHLDQLLAVVGGD